MKLPLTEVITPKEKMVYCLPDDTVRHCREIMSQLRIRNLPIIDKGQVVGIVTLKDLADSSFAVTDIGGKKGFIHNITGRRGLPAGTVLHEEARGPQTRPGEAVGRRLFVSVGRHEVPHPYKHEHGVADSRRSYGPLDLATDVELCEDAHFAVSVVGRTQDCQQVYACVADGVGSWRQYGVDPRQYAHSLVSRTMEAVLADERRRLIRLQDGHSASQALATLEPIHPLRALIEGS